MTTTTTTATTERKKELTAIEEMLGAFEVCRRFGFPSEDIYVNYNPNSRRLGIRLITDGERMDGFDVIDWPGDARSFAIAWEKAAEGWNRTFNDEERGRIYFASRTFANWGGLIGRMKANGFGPRGGFSQHMDTTASLAAMGVPFGRPQGSRP